MTKLNSKKAFVLFLLSMLFTCTILSTGTKVLERNKTVYSLLFTLKKEAIWRLWIFLVGTCGTNMCNCMTDPGECLAVSHGMPFRGTILSMKQTQV